MLSLLATSLLYSTSAHAETITQAPLTPVTVSIYLDGQQLHSEVKPLNINGTVLVPIRKLFEAQGAKLSWNNTTKTINVTKGGTTLTYRIGELTATLNRQPLELTTPGRISNGNAMIPLRFVSEALGSSVKWDPSTRSVRISSAVNFETSVIWGVNLRTSPDTQGDSSSVEMLPAGTKVHVSREVDAFWIEVRTQDNRIGYISAKPKYTNYTSPSLIEKQATELIAYGKKYLGTPYEFGASTDQTDTFDCSSFVKRVFQDILATDLPRVSYDQANAGTKVSIDELRKGDLLFFSARNLEIGHVGIYAGNNQILHTYSKKLGVHVEAFDSQWKERFVTARRIL